MAQSLLQLTDAGLYCALGDFYIDPWSPVKRAVITHAHADHARPGHGKYLCSAEGEAVLRARLSDIELEALPYGQRKKIGDVTVSLHPAGHIIGSAQVRVEHKGQVWVVTGDYKTEADSTCTPFELQRCNTFVCESTFGLPVYRWEPQANVFAEMNAWWRNNAAAGRASVVYAYALGKAQRVLAGLEANIGPIYCHGSVMRMNTAYSETQRSVAPALKPLPGTIYAGEEAGKQRGERFAGALILAPPSADGTPWLRRFGDYASAFVSGWMRLRGARRRRAVDRGFVLSDHADWPALTQTIRDTGCEQVWVTHGYSAVLARWAAEQGLQAATLRTQFEEETT